MKIVVVLLAVSDARSNSVQCFAPREMKPLGKWLSKIKEDFTEALPHWQQFFDQWVFAHNDVKGLPPDVLQLLLQLSADHKPVSATHFGYAELLAEFKQLSPANVASLLGPAPGLDDMVGVRLEDIMPLLDHIALQPEPLTADIRPVPAEKLQHNQLSQAVATLLKAGMTRAELVRKYLRGIADQRRYDRLAAAFRQRYEQLKSDGLPPDDIFAGLQKFVGGNSVPSPAHQAATLAILACFFEACEIFERPTGDAPS